MHNTAKHTPGPLNKAIHAIPMLYAEAFAGSNNKEFVVELYEDARLLEKAAPAMYEALQAMLNGILFTRGASMSEDRWQTLTTIARTALAQAEGHQHG